MCGGIHHDVSGADLSDGWTQLVESAASAAPLPQTGSSAALGRCQGMLDRSHANSVVASERGHTYWFTFLLAVSKEMVRQAMWNLLETDSGEK